jgi:hypothetical protein
VAKQDAFCAGLIFILKIGSNFTLEYRRRRFNASKRTKLSSVTSFDGYCSATKRRHSSLLISSHCVRRVPHKFTYIQSRPASNTPLASSLLSYCVMPGRKIVDQAEREQSYLVQDEA